MRVIITDKEIIVIVISMVLNGIKEILKGHFGKCSKME